MQRSGVNPVTLEVVRNALASIADEMRVIIMRSARSPVIREAGDLSCVLTDARGRVIAEGRDHPIHLGVMAFTVKELLTRVPAASLRPGDQYITNALDVGGNHLPDVKLIKPFFFEGELVAFAMCLAHWADVGGMIGGSYYTKATEIYQEGLQIPPIRLFDARGTIRPVMDFIVANVRDPVAGEGDILGQYSANEVAGRDLADTPIEIEGNDVGGFADAVYLSFVNDADVRGNRLERNGRYGLHTMYCQDNRLEENRFTRNVAGCAIMFSNHLRIERNDFVRNRGSRTYGVLLRDCSDGHFVRNRFVANTVYDLPIGPGRRFLSEGLGPVGKVLQGWTIGAIVTYQSGIPFYIVSNRATFNNFNAALAPALLTGMSFEEFKKNMAARQDESKVEDLWSAAYAVEDDRLPLSYGGSLTQSLPNHSDVYVRGDGREFDRRWLVEPGPGSARHVTVRVTARTGRTVARRDYETLIYPRW